MGYAWRVRERAEVEYGDAGKSDADRLADLGDEIATLAAHIHAATHRFLVLIARFDVLRGWEPSGHRDCGAWLSARTGIDRGAALEKVRAARALETLPETSLAMARGELSFSQVRALTRVATADNEVALLELAREAPTAQLERMVRAWRRGNRQDEAEQERERHASRTLSVFPDDEGMYVVRGRLTPEVGALLMRAIEAAADQLFRGAGPYPDPTEAREAAARRRADAIGPRRLPPRANADFRAEAPRLPSDPVRALQRDNALHGAVPDAWTAAPRRERAADVREELMLEAEEMVVHGR